MSPGELARALDAAGHPGWGAFDRAPEPPRRPLARIAPSSSALDRSLEVAIAVMAITVVVLAFLVVSGVWR